MASRMRTLEFRLCDEDRELLQRVTDTREVHERVLKLAHTLHRMAERAQARVDDHVDNALILETCEAIKAISQEARARIADQGMQTQLMRNASAETIVLAKDLIELQPGESVNLRDPLIGKRDRLMERKVDELHQAHVFDATAYPALAEHVMVRSIRLHDDGRPREQTIDLDVICAHLGVGWVNMRREIEPDTFALEFEDELYSEHLRIPALPRDHNAYDRKRVLVDSLLDLIRWSAATHDESEEKYSGIVKGLADIDVHQPLTVRCRSFAGGVWNVDDGWPEPAPRFDRLVP